VSALFVVAGLGLVTLPALVRDRLERLPPVDWCRATSASIRFGLGLVQFGLAATAAPTTFRTLGIDQVADACSRIFGPAAPGGDVTGLASALLLTWVVVARRKARRHVRLTTRLARIEPWLGTHSHHDGINHVTIPSDHPIAYAVPGNEPQVVVSERLQASLSAEELAAVRRHETSHLRHGHHRQLALACEIETVFDRLDIFRRSAVMLRLAVERVADEDAITTSDHRSQLRSALAKTARSLVSAVPAFTPADTIVHRLAALDRPARSSGTNRVAGLAVMVVPLAIAAAGATAWALASHHLLFELVNVCFG
jgi:beta-lactamase regulating signal transducer with metallopeptidase domain